MTIIYDFFSQIWEQIQKNHLFLQNNNDFQIFFGMLINFQNDRLTMR